MKPNNGTVTHAEIRDGKIWIHYDGIEDSITGEQRDFVKC
ncbi:MAG: element excision factor XisI family protein [Cyanobacteria bacterium J06629_18]